MRCIFFFFFFFFFFPKKEMTRARWEAKVAPGRLWGVFRLFVAVSPQSLKHTSWTVQASQWSAATSQHVMYLNSVRTCKKRKKEKKLLFPLRRLFPPTTLPPFSTWTACGVHDVISCLFQAALFFTSDARFDFNPLLLVFSWSKTKHLHRFETRRRHPKTFPYGRRWIL